MTGQQAVERQAAQANLTRELVEALEEVVGWFPGRQAWHTDFPVQAVERDKKREAEIFGGAA